MVDMHITGRLLMVDLHITGRLLIGMGKKLKICSYIMQVWR